MSINFSGKVVVVTGAGNGLGRAYAMAFASRGAKVVVNDLGGSFKGEGASTRAADKVVDEIKSAGGTAIANYDSVENGAAIIKTAIDAWGRVDVVVNNAGILRDKSFVRMTDQDWDLVYRVHLKGTYAVTKAAWPYFREQKYGRVVNISSASGLYGNFGQANYSAAKLGIVGFSSTLAKEGASRNIHVNVLCPVAGSRMTETVLPPDLVEAMKPDYVAPLVLVLAHESCEENGSIFEVGAGWIANVRWQRNEGLLLPLTAATSPEAYMESWDKLSDWSKPQYPDSLDLAMIATHATSGTEENSAPKMSKSDSVDPNVALGAKLPESTRVVTAKDVCLYALSVGVAQEDPVAQSELKFTYESHPEFAMLPQMGVTMVDLMSMASLPGITFNPMMLLHGEQYLEVLNHPIPTSDTFKTTAKISELWDKEKAALVVIESVSSDSKGKPIFLNKTSAFIRGIGGWGGERGPKPPSYKPPSRNADSTITQKTNKNQALLYRIPSGDANPLHADPNMSAMGGFEVPILHGLCTFGFAVRAVLKEFAHDDTSKFKAVNVRFSGHVFPGETLQTNMWKVSPTRVVFETKVLERNTTVISNAMVDLNTPSANM